MRFIHVSQYDYDTMQLAQPIYDRMKRILLAAGRTIHPKYLDRIKEMKISTLLVEDAVSKGISLDEMLDMPTWLDTLKVIQDSYELASKNQLLNILILQKTITTIIQEVQKRKIIVLVPTSSVANELKEYAHIINVTLLAIQIGKSMGYNNAQLRDLAMGSLLHDIGKVLTDDPHQHPNAGFDYIRRNREISLVSAHVAFQHHETMNGKGFPRSIVGEQFLETAQICGLANYYERLISEGDTLPHVALEMIMVKSGIEYSENVIQAFVNSIPSYIPGTKIKLSNEQDGVVIGIKTHLHRPVVRLLENEEEVDLASNPSLMIKMIQ
ncbi:HD domain-containing protein [Bacillus sp. 31A1R]|uniref:HD domain-containing protein n=1 Tax=Robertmurraya mangrovi TaxID=3098077 RepID=A0ABU5IVS1_9BACI|nr:HD domain-containing phosphohydrolase [Bacillus sp. 31A1R]MDZ5471211.1 HD domain-containing protein [Bacillus sp. 31A1R]